MSVVTEVHAEHGPERQHPEASSTESAAPELTGSMFGGVLSALGADGGDDRHASTVMRHRSSGEVRAVAMRRIQAGAGNLHAQQFVAQLRRAPAVQRQCGCGGTCPTCQTEMPALEEEESAPVQRQAARSGADTADADVIPGDSPGQPLDRSTRAFMEPRFGRDFSGVRVHTDSRAADSAKALAANAYTTGRDIYFAAGKYAPGSRDGQHLLAHELTHTAQPQNGALPMAASRVGNVAVGAADDALEREAEQTADRVVQFEHAGPVLPGGDSQPRPMAAGLARVQRDPDNAAQPKGDDPKVAKELDDETKAWEANADQDADLMLRAFASRMVLLLKWRPHPSLQTLDDLHKFASECDTLAKTELDTLRAFSPQAAEGYLAFYPKGFPLTWGGRIKAALTMGVDPKTIWDEWQKARKELGVSAKSVPPGILDEGLPVPFGKIGRLDDFSLWPSDANLAQGVRADIFVACHATTWLRT
jgi:hypothetical protein